MTNINAKMQSATTDDTNDWTPHVKDVCLAKFDVDGRWSRGCIKDVNKETGEYDVFFADYGDSEWHPRADIRKPWNDILRVRSIIIQWSCLSFLIHLIGFCPSSME